MATDSTIHTHSPWLIVRQFVGHGRSLGFVENNFASIQTYKTATATVHHAHNVVAAVAIALDDTTRGVAGCGMDAGNG